MNPTVTILAIYTAFVVLTVLERVVPGWGATVLPEARRDLHARDADAAGPGGRAL